MASPFFGAGGRTKTFFNQALPSSLQYTFPAVSRTGNFELTYVIINTGNDNQFSEDPEFDVET